MQGGGEDSAAQARSATRAQLFARLARAVAATDAEGPLALRLCRSFVDTVGAEGGAITLAYTEPERITLCFTDPTADRFEDLQEVLGEGPGPDAYASAGAVAGTVGGSGAQQWPILSAAARSVAGPVTLHAFPMRADRSVLGVVTVYRRDPESLTLEPGDSLFLADAIAAAIVHQADTENGSRWDARDRINQATGMVVAQLAVPPQDALALMRAFAFSHALTLDEVATEVVERRQNFRRNADLKGDETP